MPTVSFNTHLPGYEVLTELGRGNTRVLKARHLPTGDIVAIKQYAFATDIDTLRRFERESQIMTQIDHPNIVRVREVQLDAAMPYVVMDFVEGGDLRGLLRQQGHLDVPTTVRLGLQLTGAFRAMHPLHVVHRDIKPENVLYRRLASGELHFLLTDFGIAKLRADESARTRTGQSLMTYEYAAPEQFDNPRQVDEAADYYALGAVLYECLTGRVPFVLHDETGLALFMQQVLTARIPEAALPPGQPLPPSLAMAVRQLLTRNPASRLRATNPLELLLEESRIEFLKASRSGQTAPASLTRTLAGPVAATPRSLPDADEPDEVLALPTTTSTGTWLMIAGLVLATILASGWYTRSHRQPARTEVIRQDSAYQTAPATTAADSTSTDDSPTESDEEASTENQPESVNQPYQITADTTSTRGTPADSVTAAPPDSTQ